MRRGQHASILHMALQIPELLQANIADINNIGRGHDGRFWVRPLQRRAERHHEPEEVLIQGEEVE